MRTRWKILIGVLVIAVIVVAIVAAFITGLIVIPRASKLTITPSDFTLESGGSIMLTARLESDSFILSGKNITWSVSDGSLDKTSGDSVLYTAPTVTENTSVTITASFAGDRYYLGSSASANGVVTPPEAAPTTLTITPSTFEVESNGTVTLTATLTPSSAPSTMITWSLVGPGTLSPSTGVSVTYEAPEVEENTTVTITATFPGTSEYLSSSATCTGFVLPPGVTVRKATTLTVSPSSFTLKPGGTATLTATLKDIDGNTLTGKTITWSLVGQGTLSSTTGVSVTYTAPSEVAEEITVTLTATFAGDENYTGSTATSVGEITPVTVAGEEYVLTFTEALLKNAKITGPVTLGVIKVTKLTADTMEITGFNLSRIGLTASNVNITSLEIYATSITSYSPELGETLKISGKETISMGPYTTLTLENAVIRMVRMSANKGEFKTIEVFGEYVGGTEPYIPTIIYTPTVELSEGYALTGPVTYGELTEATSSFEVGKGVISDLALVHPVQYSLSRSTDTFTSVGKWTARASKAILTDVSSNLIYITFTAYGLPFTFTGEDFPDMHGYERGTGGTINNGAIHMVYAEIGGMMVEDFVIEILRS